MLHSYEHDPIRFVAFKSISLDRGVNKCTDITPLCDGLHKAFLVQTGLLNLHLKLIPAYLATKANSFAEKKFSSMTS